MCDYKSGNFRDFKNISYCEVSGDVKVYSNDSEIVISNPHQNVKAVLINQKETFFIPNGIDNFYPELRLLIIVLSKLTRIFARNFEHFPDLEYLNLNYNQIEILEENLFKFNQKLRFIFLNENRIKLIDPNAFKCLNNLKHLSLEDNLNFNTTVVGQSSIKVFTKSIVKEFWDEIMETVKFTILDIDIEMTDEKIYLLNKIKKKFDDKLKINLQTNDCLQNSDAQFFHKYLIILLIMTSLLIYSCNFLILYCLYPNEKNEEF